ncbi:hypothetical protein LCGC14_2588060 [marine sediment metagenome]|uniref:Uncharacterized protein n=1 Tax=marine sediment metagenome TaxID=412755 RepID=A0A0F9B0F0_9ZZZZ
MNRGNAGKGSVYRPVNKERYDRNYERIFRKKGGLSREDCVMGSTCGSDCNDCLVGKMIEATK